MKDKGKIEKSMKPTDLRGILKYVPMFRDQIFVIALDGRLVAHENFQNVVLDIAVLSSLSIQVVLVHGAGQQLLDLAKERTIKISNAHGEGVTDHTTMALATEASSRVNMQIMQGLTSNGLRCAQCNGVRSSEVGIVKGEDQLLSGKVDKLDLDLFYKLLGANTIPVVTPIVFNRDGAPLRVNSDLLASELASQLKASKLVYMTTQDALRINGQAVANLALKELQELLENNTDKIPERLLSKSQQAIRAILSGTPRAHILDGRIFGALLNELFDKVGIGTMIYSNDYQSIRVATIEDAYSIYNITRIGVRTESLIERSLESIEKEVDDFLVYEIDGSIVACARTASYDNGAVIELSSVYVQSFYQNKNVGRQMVEYSCREAKKNGALKIIALTTQSKGFFQKICGFVEGDFSDLPEARQTEYQNNGRNSNILFKNL